MRFTIAEQVEAAARAFPDRIAVEMVGGGVFTYRQLIDRMERLAAALGEVPTGRNGPMVAVLLSNGVDSLLSFLACQLRGLAAVPINTRLAPAEMGYILKDSDAAVLLSGGDQLERARTVAAEYGQRLIDCDQIGASAPALPKQARARPKGDDTAVVFYTSGTTGFPKGAAITHQLLGRAADVVGLGVRCRLDRRDAGAGSDLPHELQLALPVRILSWRPGSHRRAVRRAGELRGIARHLLVVVPDTDHDRDAARTLACGRPQAASRRPHPVVLGRSAFALDAGRHDAGVSERTDLRSLWLDRGRVGHERDQAARHHRSP